MPSETTRILLPHKCSQQIIDDGKARRERVTPVVACLPEEAKFLKCHRVGIWRGSQAKALFTRISEYVTLRLPVVPTRQESSGTCSPTDLTAVFEPQLAARKLTNTG